jgi:hypothetical protein
MLMADKTLYLRFDRMSQPIELIGCDCLLETFPLIFPGWNIEEEEAGNQTPVLRLARDKDIFTLEASWLDKPIRRKDKVNAICALVAELIRAYVNDQEDLLCLHGAAADFCGSLVVFPSLYRSGKSVLSACLAAAGIPLFCDDVIPISLSEGRGIAPGLAPRLRLPLPENLGSETRIFIDDHSGLRGKYYLYLDIDGSGLVARGRQLPIGAFVLLEREVGSEARFEKVSEAEVLRRVVWQNFSRLAEAPRILEVLNQLVTDSKLYRLRYDRAEDAVELLRREFKAWPERQRQKLSKSKLTSQQNRFEDHLPPGCYLRNAGISVLQVGDQSFLADRDGARIHQLNSIGSAVWSLLAEPITRLEIIDLLCSAYPDPGRCQIDTDVSALLDDLMAKGLMLLGDSSKCSVSGKPPVHSEPVD